MADEQSGGGEVARRVFEALEALKGIDDEADRAREISVFLRAYGPEIKELSDLRRDFVLGQRKQEVSVRKIAAQIGVSPSTVQDIERGYSGSGKTRPRKAKDGDEGTASEADA
ncbi:MULTISPECIES: helix-turn-helix domain-containing protein [unclassified Streptomyces]|uniref:helix-turn-helix domain-containing protein n=1 Tax=unclassified Streptomyces TaxID=2593676 RepID=UPI002024FE81|nr:MULTISPECIES: helix-turn-helix domain-containing protein [unclassified Streptomyces]MCX4550549.1 helix-turn-helix domain-containing protein [Streptomyces sp. NBC_01500]WSC21996.1 helix-turn-helix domain-containing protein [Streptomyces sp. NBC_01766]